MVGGGGGWASQRRSLPVVMPQTVVLCSQQTTRMYTNHSIDQDGHWQQFGTQPILISAPQWANRPCNAPTQFYRVGKKPSVKADLAVYSHTFKVGGQCMSESFTLGHNLDSVLVTLWSVFANPVTYSYTIFMVYLMVILIWQFIGLPDLNDAILNSDYLIILKGKVLFKFFNRL